MEALQELLLQSPSTDAIHLRENTDFSQNSPEFWRCYSRRLILL